MPRKAFKAEMPLYLKLLFEVVHKRVLPRGERKYEATYHDMGIVQAIVLQEPVNWPALILHHMARIVDPTEGPHQLAYGNLLTHVFRVFQVPLGGL